MARTAAWIGKAILEKEEFEKWVNVFMKGVTACKTISGHLTPSTVYCQKDRSL